MKFLQFDPSKSLLLIAEDVFISIHGHRIGKEMQRSLIGSIQRYFRVGKKVNHSTIVQSIVSAAGELYIADPKNKNTFIALFTQQSNVYFSRFGRRPALDHKSSNNPSLYARFLSFSKILYKV